MKEIIDWRNINDSKDAKAAAASILPPVSGEDRFWRQAARSVFTAVVSALAAAGRGSDHELARLLSSPIQDIADLCQGQEGHAYIEDPSGRQAAGVIDELMSYQVIKELLNRHAPAK